MNKPLATSCCHAETDQDHDHKKRFDYIFYGTSGILLITIAAYLAGFHTPLLDKFAISSLELLGQMWWGILIGIFFVGLMSKVPREYFQVLMGRGDSIGGIFRAVVAGVFLDMCSHGILLVAAKLYERGVSLAQIMAFLIASPWNSFSLTVILISLIGLNWTLIFIAGSCLVAFTAGLAYMALTKSGILPENPNTVEISSDFSLVQDAKARLKNFRPNISFFADIVKNGVVEGKMLVRWLLLGIVIAGAIQTFVPMEMFSEWLGPSLIGLAVTLVAATVIEVCSEGSVPIASVIFHQAKAAGNAFVFLMAGVSTDYTEIMILRQATGSWKIAFSLPIVTVPQILLLGYLMNMFQ
jgi:uncharacterized membrane protein YraQ (UPF0718 family)